MKTEYDEKMIRCPKLGDEMTFSYCLTEAGDLPCARIITCWQAAFGVTDVLKRVLTPDQWNRFASVQPKEKVLSLIELIEKAKAKK
jgi:hypothetical protein